MKRTIVSLAVALAVLTPLASQTLDEVLKNHFNAIGQEKVLNVKDMAITGKMVQMGIEIPFSQFLARPGMIRVEGTFQGLTFIQTFNREEGWSLNPFAGQSEPQPFGEDELKSMKYQSDMDGMLWNWKEKGYEVILDGTETVEGTECFKVRLTTPDGDVFTSFIDTEDYLLLRQNSKVKVQGNEAESDSYFSNYLKEGGMVFPGKTETRMNGQTVMTIVVEKVSIDTGLDPAIFEKPGK